MYVKRRGKRPSNAALSLWDPRTAGRTMPEPIINHGYFVGSSGLGLWDPRTAGRTMPEPSVNRAYIAGVVYDAARDDYPRLKNPPGISATPPTMAGLGGYGRGCGCGCGPKSSCACRHCGSRRPCGCEAPVSGFFDDAWSSIKNTASSATSWIGEKAQGVSSYVLGGLDELCGADAQAEIKKLNSNAWNARTEWLKTQEIAKKAQGNRRAEAEKLVAKAQDLYLQVKSAVDWANSWMIFGYNIGVPACEKYYGTPTTKRGASGLGAAPAAAVALPATKLVVLGVGLAMAAGLVYQMSQVNKVAVEQLVLVKSATAAFEAADKQVQIDCGKDPTSSACAESRKYALEVAKVANEAMKDYTKVRAEEGKKDPLNTLRVVSIAGVIGLITFFVARPLIGSLTAKRGT